MVASLLLAGMPVFAAGQPADSGLNYLAGPYVVIGKHADSEKTYTGRMTVSTTEQGLKMVRMIGGRSTQATGTMNTATPDQIPVLRVSFREDGKLHQQTCMVSSDLDNYPRVSCYLYNKLTKRVGLEAWFSDHGQLRHQ